ETDRLFILRYYTVFNVGQCDDLPPALIRPVAPTIDFEPLVACQAILDTMPSNRPQIAHGGGRACYSPSLDQVNMPAPQVFESREDYYSTLFHELTHATGHA